MFVVQKKMPKMNTVAQYMFKRKKNAMENYEKRKMVDIETKLCIYLLNKTIDPKLTRHYN